MNYLNNYRRHPRIKTSVFIEKNILFANTDMSIFAEKIISIDLKANKIHQNY